MADINRPVEDLAKNFGIAQDKLQSFSDAINKLVSKGIEDYKKLNKELSIGTDLTKQLAENYKNIKDIIDKTDLSNLISQEAENLDFLKRKLNLETKLSGILNELAYHQDELNNNELKISEQIEQLHDSTNGYILEEGFNLMAKNVQLRESLKLKSEELKKQIDIYTNLIRQKQAAEDLKRTMEQLRSAIENAFGFNKFKSLFGIFGKLPGVETLFNRMGMSAKIFLGLTTIFLQTLFSTLYKAFDDINGAFVKTAKSFGLLKDESKIFKNFISDATIDLTKYGVTAEETAATVTNMVDTFGSLSLFNEKAAADITLISKQLGVANKELTDGVMTLMSFGKIDMVKATKVVYFASALSKAAGVPLPKVMDDVAKAGDKARGMIKGGAEQLIKAATYARRLGTDLEKVAEVGRKMLDFQESITDEIEASVLLGSNISFQKARELFYIGKTQEAYDEIFKVVKSIGDFNKLDIFQKEQIAKSTGLPLADLQKQAQIREDLYELEIRGTDEQKAMVREYKKLTDAGDGLLKNTIEERAERVKNIKNLKEIEEITARIKGLFLDIGRHLLPIIENTLKVINYILEKMDNPVVKFIIGLGGVVITVIAIVKAFKILKTVILDAIKVMTLLKEVAIATEAVSAVAPVAAGASGLSTFMAGLAALDAGVILAIGAAFVLFAGSILILAKAGQEFNTVDWESLGKIAASLVVFGGVVAALTASGVLETAAIGIALLGASFIPLGASLLMIGGGLLMAGNGMKAFGEGLKFAVDALKDFGQNVSFFDSLALAGVFSQLSGSISNFDLDKLKSIATTMQSLASALNSISAFKGMPELTLPTNTINTTNTPTVLTNTPVISPIQTNSPTTNIVTDTTNPTAMIESVKQGIKEGMTNISLNIYLDGSKILGGINKNVAFREDTGGVLMKQSLA